VDTEEIQPLLQHLGELRRRLLIVALAWLSLSVVSYLFVDDLYQILAHPLFNAMGHEIGRRLMYTGLTEAFVVYIKTAMWAGFMLGLPIILYQLWAFLSPAFYENERKIVRAFFIATTILFFGGILLAYFVVIPMAWHFFLSFEQRGLNGLPIVLDAKMDDYLSLVLQILMAFGITFLLPLVLAILIYKRIVAIDNVKKYRRHVFVAILTIAAILTPPDIISQLALAIPLWLLFESTLFICGVLTKSTKPSQNPQSK
jgi:sec-independent protein translocase protein TatC